MTAAAAAPASDGGWLTSRRSALGATAAAAAAAGSPAPSPRPPPPLQPLAQPQPAGGPGPDPLHRRRPLGRALLRHWARLAATAVAGGCWMSLVVFCTLKASLSECGYAVVDTDRFVANGQLMDSLTELTQCRLTVKNLAWSEHWVAVFWQALVREGYEMTVPLTFGLAFWGDRLGMPAARRAAYVYGLPCVFALFVLLWHAGLGQPAVLRSSAPGTAVFYTILGCCALEVALRVRRMLPDRPASAVYFVLFVFGFAVVFPDYVYSFLVLPLCFGGNVPGARRLAVRMLLHPFICELSLAAIRNFCRHLGAAQGREGLAAILLVAAHVVKSVFGRFLISQVGDVGSVVLIQSCVHLLDGVSRMLVKDSDSMYLYMLYGDKASGAVLSSRRHNDLWVYEQQISMLCEYAALICMPSFFVAGRFAFGGKPLDVRTLVSNCVSQLVIAAGWDLVLLAYDTFYHGVDHPGVWARRHPALLPNLFLHFTALAFTAFYVTLFSLFCPNTQFGGLHMDYCYVVPFVTDLVPLPNVWLWKRWPNHSPKAAQPFLNAPDLVFWQGQRDYTKCGGRNPLENCMLDSWFPTYPVSSAGAQSSTIIHLIDAEPPKGYAGR